MIVPQYFFMCLSNVFVICLISLQVIWESFFKIGSFPHNFHMWFGLPLTKSLMSTKVLNDQQLETYIWAIYKIAQYSLKHHTHHTLWPLPKYSTIVIPSIMDPCKQFWEISQIIFSAVYYRVSNHKQNRYKDGVHASHVKINTGIRDEPAHRPALDKFIKEKR